MDKQLTYLVTQMHAARTSEPAAAKDYAKQTLTSQDIAVLPKQLYAKMRKQD